MPAWQETNIRKEMEVGNDACQSARSRLPDAFFKYGRMRRAVRCFSRGKTVGIDILVDRECE